MENTNIYKKVGKRYEPIGVMYGDSNYLTDGIWIVRRTRYSKCITNGDYAKSKYILEKLGSGDTELSWQDVYSLEKKKSELLSEFLDTHKEYTLDGIFSWILGKLIKKN